MIDKARLLCIADLKAGKIERMNENQLEVYSYNLLSFADLVPEQEERVKSALTAKDYDALSGAVGMLGDILSNIHADDLAKDCKKQTGDFRKMKHEKIEAYVTYFLSSISMLSIDIQMAAYKDAPPGTVKAESGKRTILAVDDAAFFLNTLKAFLQDTGYKLVCVTSGETALAYLEDHRPDLFILDIEMPGMNGYDLADKLRRAGHTAPIIFLTGNATADYVLKAIKAGASDFLVKPTDRAQVLNRIGKFI